jgi:hypothetical protein
LSNVIGMSDNSSLLMAGMLLSVGCLGIYIYQMDDGVNGNKCDSENEDLDIQDDTVEKEKPIIHKTKTKSIRRKSTGTSKRRF